MLTITALRTRAGMSKAALARAAALDQSLLGKIEAGRTRPYAPELQRLARALGFNEDRAQQLLAPWPNGGE